MKKDRISMREPKSGAQGSKGTTYTYPNGAKKTGPTIRFS